MPPIAKPLHQATSIDALREIALNTNLKSNLPQKAQPKDQQRLLKALDGFATKCYKEGHDGDHELMYVFILRLEYAWHSLEDGLGLKVVRNLVDDKLGKRVLTLLSKKAVLEQTLTQRYEEEYPSTTPPLHSHAPASLPTASRKSTGTTTPVLLDNGRRLTSVSPISLNGSEGGTFITSAKLAEMLQSSPESLLILDVRPSSDFQASHLKASNLISLSERVIMDPLSDTYIGRRLDEPSKKYWSGRYQFDLIVIVQNIGGDKVEHRTERLYEVLFKLSERKLPRQPRILQGGFGDFVASYPHLTTDPSASMGAHRRLPAQHSSSMSNAGYPSFGPVPSPAIESGGAPTLNDSNGHRLRAKRSETPSDSEPETVQPAVPPAATTLPPPSAVRPPRQLPATPKKTETATVAPRKLQPLTPHRSPRTPQMRSSDAESSIASAKPTTPAGHGKSTPSAPSSLSRWKSNPNLAKRYSGSARVDDETPLMPSRSTKPQVPPNVAAGDDDEMSDRQFPAPQRKAMDESVASNHSRGHSVTSDTATSRSRPSTSLRTAAVSLPSVDRLVKPQSGIVQNWKGQRDFSEERRSVQVSGSLVGLKNLNNTCYMNAVLQCLFMCQRFREYFVRARDSTYPLVLADVVADRSQIDADYCSVELARLFDVLLEWRQSVRAVKPRELKKVIDRLSDKFPIPFQHDASELLDWLLERIGKETNAVLRRTHERSAVERVVAGGSKAAITVPPRLHSTSAPTSADTTAALSDSEKAEHEWRSLIANEESIVTQLFFGQLRYKTTCRRCSHSSVTFEPFKQLQLQIVGDEDTSLDHCLADYLKPELLNDPTSLYFCATCREKTPAERRIDLWRMPDVLVIHLKRFRQFRDNLFDKIERHVRYDREWSLSRHVAPDNDAGAVPQYRLFGVCWHIGGYKAGHYVADVRPSGQLSSAWMSCSDEEVGQVGEESVRNRCAYLLFYQRVV